MRTAAPLRERGLRRAKEVSISLLALRPTVCAALTVLLSTGCIDGPNAAPPRAMQPDLDPDILADPDPLAELPAVLSTPAVARLDNTPSDNPTTPEGAALGRALFYDVRLSASENVSCGSCHLQENAFADPDALSTGHLGGKTGRNAMGLVNVRFYASGEMFWDERAEDLETQVLMPIQDPVEMGMSLAELEDVIEAAPEYTPLFEAAFGDDAVSSDRIGYALAQFVRTLNSGDSPYDRGPLATGDPRLPFDTLSASENRGKGLFFGRAGCAACHLAVGAGPGQPPQAAVFYINGAVVNGLNDGRGNDDAGLGAITGDPRDVGRMKSPSLRNVAVTGPYMHDGRFDTLAEVVDFYDRGVQAPPNLDPRLRGPGGTPRRLGLSPQDRGDLVDFLEALTDDRFLDDPSLSDPFLE